MKKQFVLFVLLIIGSGMGACQSYAATPVTSTPLGITSKTTNGEVVQLLREYGPSYQIANVYSSKANEVRNHIQSMQLNQMLPFFIPANTWIFEFGSFVITDPKGTDLTKISGSQSTFRGLMETQSKQGRHKLYELYQHYQKQLAAVFTQKDEYLGDINLGGQSPQAKNWASLANNDQGYYLAQTLYRQDNVCAKLSIMGKRIPNSREFTHTINIDYMFNCNANQL